MMLSNCGAREDSWEFLGLQDDEGSQSKGDQPWIFIERTDAEAPILWLPDAKSHLTREDPDAGEDWGQEEKGATEDEMVGWHHRLNGLESEQTLGDSETQGALTGSWSQTQLSDWTTMYLYGKGICFHFLTCYYTPLGSSQAVASF